MKYLHPILALLLIINQGCSQLSSIRHNPENNADWIEQTLHSMTLDQKIGQMILMTFSPSYMSDSSQEWLTIKDNIINKHVFGYHIWHGDIYAARHYIRKMQEMSDIPLVFSADFERGVGLKFDGAVEFPTNMAFGATRNPDYAYKMGAYTALEAKAIGFSMAFAPDADIQNNPDNPIINTRSFGETPELVSEMVTAFIRGTHDNRFGAAVKHFPGHGNTNFDSHLDLATIYSDLNQMKTTELRPFQAAVDNDVDMIMTAHIYVPCLEKTPGKPATLSKSILTSLLRNKINFEGIIITDAMGMGGIKANYTEKYAVVSAIQAGCDLLINNGTDASYTFNCIREAINTGRLSEARIDSSVRRLLTLKANLGLNINPLLDIDSGDRLIGQIKVRDFAQQVADDAVTLVRDDLKLIPLKESYDDLTIINIHDINTKHEYNSFQRGLLNFYPEAKVFNLDLSDNSEAYRTVIDSISEKSTVIIGAFVRYGAYKGHVDFNKIQIDFINQLNRKTENIIVYSFGNPYILRQIPGIGSYLCGYGWQAVCQKAAVKALTGQIDISGKLPVTIPGIADFGSGIHLPKNPVFTDDRRKSVSFTPIRRGFPSEAAIDPSKLKEIENMLNKGVQDSAYPGGVFLAMKDGIIVEEYAFGHLSYEPGSPAVNIRTIYDLASMTKPIATTAAAMLLYDKGQIDLDEKVSATIPEFGQGGKENVTIRNLLTHTSGLPPFIQLWKVADSPQAMLNYLYNYETAYPTGTETQYSCMGMIVLQKVIEAKTGQPLDSFLSEILYKPLGMNFTCYNPPAKWADNIAPTEYDPERGGIIHGKVHDENAYYLGGVSGNAGLFSTARDLAIFSQMLLNGGCYRGTKYFKPETVELFTQRQNVVEGSDRTLGWGTPSGKSSSGQYFSENSIGHTGFTGTSIWIDFDKKLVGILLTNRVHPTRNNHKLYDFRYRIYDLLQESVTDFPLTKNPNVDY